MSYCLAESKKPNHKDREDHQGNYRNGSDIDLTIVGDRVTAEQFLRLQLALDDLLLPYTIDLSLMRQIDNPDLLEHIGRVGTVIYERMRGSEP